MGVPKFFRYISERYPCLSELVDESQVPEFDNLYLDMNGIIHNCTHPNDSDPLFRISEEKMFKDIFHYIDTLFKIIQPKKLFFMAVDGVAPRAKMNQQRSRRFRSAKDTESKEKEYRSKGIPLPTTEKFDSNCITPGTEFMTNLQDQLIYFVSLKVSSQKSWQKPKIILSGHQVPGEGEHKIMEYIRYLRSRDDYDCNTRHCLYGLDADLMMLGLCTHEPHFSLLREEVKFGRPPKSKKIVTPEDTKFFLLHLSLFREYIEMEFQELKNTLPFPFDLERIIDDWVLMGFLVGNDFIPHLPNLHISTSALPILYRTYMQILPKLDGYINESGTLNLTRFRAYMRLLAGYEIRNFEDRYCDAKYLASKSRKQLVGFESHEDLLYNDDDDSAIESIIDDLREIYEAGFFYEDIIKSSGEENSSKFNDDYSDWETDDIDNTVNTSDNEEANKIEKDQQLRKLFKEFIYFKSNYYEEKMSFPNATKKYLNRQAEEYIRAIEWNLQYYYNGLCSWSWYYPHHYAPYVYDIQTFQDFELEFDMGKPFLPFQQLLAVLPSLSKSLLPAPFQNLMIAEDSSILDFYPTDFNTDLNGKQQEWEAVVLIPFIDEGRLIDAMNTCYDLLTDEEKQRNTHGPMQIFNYTEENLGRCEAPNYFPPLTDNHATVNLQNRSDIQVDRDKLRKGLLPQVNLDLFVRGFPTFHHLKFVAFLEKRKLKIFQAASRNESMIVKLISSSDESGSYFEETAASLLNSVVYVGWPYLTEAKVISVLNKEKQYSFFSDSKELLHSSTSSNEFSQVLSNITEKIAEKGVDIGPSKILLYVNKLRGIRCTSVGNGIRFEKIWRDEVIPYPLQAVVKDIKVHNEVDEKIVPLSEFFKTGSTCFLLHPDYYGCRATVCEVLEPDNLIKVQFRLVKEPDIAALGLHNYVVPYYTASYVAQKVGVNPYMLSRITGCIFVVNGNKKGQPNNVNVGLNLKFSKQNEEIPGYSKRDASKQWLYSEKVVGLVNEYLSLFPEIVDAVGQNGNDIYSVDELFSGSEQEERFEELIDWLGNLSVANVERRKCGSELLEPEAILYLEKAIDKYISQIEKGPVNRINMEAKYLYVPTTSFEKIMPDVIGKFNLLDRVVNIRSDYTVPLGLKGTIIGILKDPLDEEKTVYDVLFDQQFGYGQKLFCKKYRAYRIAPHCLLNISNRHNKIIFDKLSESRDTRKQTKNLDVNKNRRTVNESTKTAEQIKILQRPKRTVNNKKDPVEASADYLKNALNIGNHEKLNVQEENLKKLLNITPKEDDEPLTEEDFNFDDGSVNLENSRVLLEDFCRKRGLDGVRYDYQFMSGEYVSRIYSKELGIITSQMLFSKEMASADAALKGLKLLTEKYPSVRLTKKTTTDAPTKSSDSKRSKQRSPCLSDAKFSQQKSHYNSPKPESSKSKQQHHPNLIDLDFGQSRDTAKVNSKQPKQHQQNLIDLDYQHETATYIAPFPATPKQRQPTDLISARMLLPQQASATHYSDVQLNQANPYSYSDIQNMQSFNSPSYNAQSQYPAGYVFNTPANVPRYTNYNWNSNIKPNEHFTSSNSNVVDLFNQSTQLAYSHDPAKVPQYSCVPNYQSDNFYLNVSVPSQYHQQLNMVPKQTVNQQVLYNTDLEQNYVATHAETPFTSYNSFRHQQQQQALQQQQLTPPQQQQLTPPQQQQLTPPQQQQLAPQQPPQQQQRLVSQQQQQQRLTLQQQKQQRLIPQQKQQQRLPIQQQQRLAPQQQPKRLTQQQQMQHDLAYTSTSQNDVYQQKIILPENANAVNTTKTSKLNGNCKEFVPRRRVQLAANFQTQNDR